MNVRNLIHPENKQLFETVFILLSIATPIATLTYLSIHNQVLGIDSWWWVYTALRNQPVIGNVFAAAAYLSPFILLHFTQDKQHNSFFIASLFMLNTFSAKLLVPEIDDYLLLTTSFLALTFIQNTVKNSRATLSIAAAVTIGYATLQGWTPFTAWLHNPVGLQHTEHLAEPVKMLGYAPVLLLLAWNKKWLPLTLLTGLMLMYPQPKFLVTAVPITVYAIHTQLLQDKNFTYPALIVAAFLTSLVIMTPINAATSVAQNELALETYCNPSTSICNPVPGDYSYGHYFTHKNYLVNNTFEYGQCHCKGHQCLTGTIICGDQHYNTTTLQPIHTD